MLKRLYFFIFVFTTTAVFSQDLEINWQRCIDSDDSKDAYDIVMFNGAYYLAGYTDVNDSDDALIIKTDTVGNVIWKKTYGGSKGDGASGIYPSGDGLIIAGGTSSTDGDISNNPYDSKVNWIFKIDTAGTMLWDRVAGGTSIDQLECSAGDGQGGLITSNRIGSHDGDVSEYYGSWDAWFVKYDSNGEIEWDFTLGTADQDVGGGVLKTSGGDYLVSCWSYMEGEGNIDCTPFNNKVDIVLAKLNGVNGEMDWQQCYGGSNYESPKVILEVDGGFLLVNNGGSTDGDCEGCGYHNPGYESDDIWVIRMDKYGNILWNKCYGGTGDEVCRSAFKTSDGGYMYFCTTNTRTAYGPNGDVSDNPAFPGKESIWVFKTDSSGNLLWERCIGGQGTEYIKFGVIQKSDNTYVLLGSTYGPYPNHDVECTNIPNGEFCWWLMELSDLTVGNEYINPNVPEVTIYPNPGSETLELDTELHSFTFILYNTQANIVIESQNQKTINTSHLNSGIYFYRILKDGEVYGSGKWVKR